MGFILCIETSTGVCSAALESDGHVVSLAESLDGRDHAGKLGVFIHEMLRGAGIEAGELSAVAVSGGPGSYTGLRIGASLAKGLCYGLDIPLIAVGSLTALAQTAVDDCHSGLIRLDDLASTRFCAMIDARRMEVYAQVFDSQLNVLSPVVAEVITPESFAEMRQGGQLLIFGDGAAKCAPVLGQGVRLIDIQPSARGMAPLARKAYQQGRFEDVAYFEPFYLKDFIVKPSSKNIF